MNDYLELATQFHTLMLSDVPQMSPRLAAEARRFTWLVDVLYDRRVKLVISAEVPPEELYTDGPLAHEFPRTISRLREMQSAGVPRDRQARRRHRPDLSGSASACASRRRVAVARRQRQPGEEARADDRDDGQRQQRRVRLGPADHGRRQLRRRAERRGAQADAR